MTIDQYAADGIRGLPAGTQKMRGAVQKHLAERQTICACELDVGRRHRLLGPKAASLSGQAASRVFGELHEGRGVLLYILIQFTIIT